MKRINNTTVQYPGNFLIVGFGWMGKAVLPLLFNHMTFNAKQVVAITKLASETDHEIASQYGIKLIEQAITQKNYIEILNQFLSSGDFLLNLSVGVSSRDLICFCQELGVLYLDTCTEPWEGFYTNNGSTASMRTNYALRETMVDLKKKGRKTALITHGANPGLISHFLKQGLYNLGHDQELDVSSLKTQHDWATLANQLDIKAIHIAEKDTQISRVPKRVGEFTNTWSAEGLLSEAVQPGEMGWGTHEKHWPSHAHNHNKGSGAAIYIERPSASIRIRSWTPTYGQDMAYMITHAESITIANYLSLYRENNLIYRPSVCYAYTPCPDALLSLHELAGKNWVHPKNHHLLLDEIHTGTDELGILLMGNKTGAYWFGSQLSINETRELAPHNNATTLQVAAGILAGILWAIEHPSEGLVEPEEIDHTYILEIARPYLGTVTGFYTDWTPLLNREILFEELVDKSDPWQFLNMRID